jgi:hypothetical protein
VFGRRQPATANLCGVVDKLSHVMLCVTAGLLVLRSGMIYEFAR